VGMEAGNCFCQFLVTCNVLHSRELMPLPPNQSECRLTSIFSLQGGGLQYSAAPNNDFSDWVGQSQDFIAVNVGYRLGALGFMAHESLPSANAGLLDQRLALKWVKDNIGSFGGNPDDVTIMGQSGGGYAVVSQMALYDGASDGLFKKAIPRSIQRSPMFKISELADRNANFASLLNCTSGQDQVECFQKASVPALVNAYANITRYTATSGYACIRLEPRTTKPDH
jgi:carboxylesterase type B